MSCPRSCLGRLDRLRENAKRISFDPWLQALIGRAETARRHPPPAASESRADRLPWFRIGDSIVRTIALTARFDHAADVALDELRAELIYPSTGGPSFLPGP